MPNVIGLTPADVLLASMLAGTTRDYGPYTTVSRVGTLLTMRSRTQAILASVDGVTEKPRVKADLRAIDGDTVTAVNAFLRPYGKVKAYWRTGEYRWHPVDGSASAPKKAKPAPRPAQVTPSQPEQAQHLAPVAVVEARPIPSKPKVVITPQVAGGSGVTIIATERRNEGKAIASKPVTKTYSQLGQVLLPHADVATLERAWRECAAGQSAGVKITGPAGTAKTLLAQEFAFSKGVPFLLVEGASIQTAADWYGGFVPNNEPGATSPFQWVWSDFALALQRGEPMVVLVDELNRVENERALNGLMGLMAWTRTTKPVGAPEALRLVPGILIMATINEGVEYVATVEIDAAVSDRLPWGVRMDYPPEPVETRMLRSQAKGLDATVAKRLVRVAATQRAKRDDDTQYPSHNVFSPRNLVAIAGSVAREASDPEGQAAIASEVIWSAVKSRFTKEDEAALTQVIEAQFGPAAVPDEALADDDDIEQMLSADD